MAFVLRSGQVQVLVHLGASGPIDEAVAAWLEALVAPHARADAGGRPGAKPARLGAAQAPLARHHNRAGRASRRPDILPLAALPGHRAGTYLIEDISISLRQLGAAAGGDPRRTERGQAQEPRGRTCRPAGRRRHRLPGRPRRRGLRPSRPRPPAYSWPNLSVRASRPWPAPSRKCGASPSSSGHRSPGCRNANDFSRSDGCLRVATWPHIRDDLAGCESGR